MSTVCREAIVAIVLDRVIMLQVKSRELQSLKQHLCNAFPDLSSILCHALFHYGVARVGLLLLTEGVPDLNAVPGNLAKLLVSIGGPHQVEELVGGREQSLRIATHVRVIDLYDFDEALKSLLEDCDVLVRLCVQKIKDTLHELDLTTLFGEVVPGEWSHALDGLGYLLKAELLRVLVINNHVAYDCLPHYVQVILLKILWL